GESRSPRSDLDRARRLPNFQLSAQYRRVRPLSLRQTIAIAKAELALLNSKLIRNKGHGNFFREIEFHQNDCM
ncbi:MAG: hypothetical protein KIT82_16735, partial [Bradyrhizobium sp.]|nr:hypothetical protein [Bradyrhizobium sp.]